VLTKRKRTRAEIAPLLAQANEMAAQGKLQSEIADTLGISVMTLHRWRKATPPLHLASHSEQQIGDLEEEVDQSQLISELQLENSRLRRLVTDLLLERMKLEEDLIQGERSPGDRMRRIPR
jgi:putative transposase